MTQTLNVEYRKVETLILFARNPRTHRGADRQARGQHRRVRLDQPALVDGSHGIIAATVVWLLRAQLACWRCRSSNSATTPSQSAPT